MPESIIEKIKRKEDYLNQLPLTDNELKNLKFLKETFDLQRKSLNSLLPEIEDSIYHNHNNILRKLTKTIEIRLFSGLTPRDVFLYRYILLDKPLLPYFNNLGLTKEKVINNIKYQVSLTYEEFEIESGELPSINTRIFDVRYKRLLDVSKEFLIYKRPENVKEENLSNFLDEIFKHYNFIPYHNFAHGFNVMQFFHILTKESTVISKHFDKETKFWVCLAAICHDAGHLGNNNAYYVNKGHDFSFNNIERSVLETYHSSNILKTLSKEGCDLSVIKEQKQLMIEAILATDMSRHFELFDKFKALNLNEQLKRDDLIDLTGFLIHTSDIANPVFYFDNYISWSKFVTQEFMQQTLNEKKNNLPVTKMMEYHGDLGFCKAQLGFINFFVLPLFKEIGNKINNDEWELMCKKNIEVLNGMIKKK